MEEDFSEIMAFVEERLKKIHKSDSELVRKHNKENSDWPIPEDGLWEQSDVVHDILAYLAERMIEMNKEKQKEMKGFLRWMEMEVNKNVTEAERVSLEDIKNKTKIEEYYHYTFEEFIGFLKTNKFPNYDPTKRSNMERIEKEFNASIEKLHPLLKKIEKTDRLIDQIVYQLYGLTEEEIIVGDITF